MSIDQVLGNASAELHVDLAAIINNYETLKSQSDSATCAAVVKADAYGLGANKVAPALYHNTDCDTFFVAGLVEGVTLRNILPDAKIYVFNGLFADQVDTYLDHNITPILNDPSQVALWYGKKAPCGVHFDTGINRLGFTESQTEEFLNTPNDLNIDLVMSHFIQSEIARHPSNEMQLDKFERVRYQLPNAKGSLCNSGGVFLGRDYHFDLLRPGIMLYGGNPGLPVRPNGIKQAFELRAKILQIREIEPGMAVGYNSLWTAAEKSRIALLNVGYADGTLKTSDRKAKVWVGGHMADVIGKVSMDMIAIDITDDKFNHVTVTDYAEILGPNITLEMVAENSTLGHYELMTGIGPRYKKYYKV
ncbi:alanine racemase [Pseudemcibacter aquimaris]|uniref:alanine racemase n=1 Tax=Pseudemcibacter aquimaris TaxID=2857064 RepID=UPI0020130FF6|nr:alanine racemase [Pseudemcibacter aquimaris]MCC3859985.1 alanine racemase [Pseudemcibacter aquimaris]WDU57316.1 alanine racemase [Pseudemcibacter aquimaris]